MCDYTDAETFIFIKENLNKFPVIPDEAKFVDVRRNKIEKIVLPKETNVQQLDASDNIIRSFESLDNINSLKVLDLGYNLIKNIPKVNIPNLVELYLMSNDIKKIENIDYPKLERLDIANNELKVVENLRCSLLKEAYFGANEICNLEDLSCLQNLKTLDLQYNKLEKLDCTLLPLSLEVLLLQGNKDLKEIKNLDKLVNLKILSIKYTKINNIKPTDNLEIW